jgi:hypothetical protein
MGYKKIYCFNMQHLFYLINKSIKHLIPHQWELVKLEYIMDNAMNADILKILI